MPFFFTLERMERLTYPNTYPFPHPPTPPGLTLMPVGFKS